MKITATTLSIPPYITANWDSISVIHMEEIEEEIILVITLITEDRVEVPGLSIDQIEEIQRKFSEFMNANNKKEMASEHSNQIVSVISDMFQQLFQEMREGPVSVIKIPVTHTPSQANLPQLSPETLNNIVKIIQSIGISESNLVNSEDCIDKCRCLYCQACSHVRDKLGKSDVKNDDISFDTEWNISQVSEFAFNVQSKEFPDEVFKVSLKPVQCSCGQKNCEHIKVVLYRF